MNSLALDKLNQLSNKWAKKKQMEELNQQKKKKKEKKKD